MLVDDVYKREMQELKVRTNIIGRNEKDSLKKE